jgi:hypothetical protein
LSSLFTNKNASVSEKEKKDNLFARWRDGTRGNGMQRKKLNANFGNILENDKVPVLISFGKEKCPVLSGVHLTARIPIFQYAPIHRVHEEYYSVC